MKSAHTADFFPIFYLNTSIAAANPLHSFKIVHTSLSSTDKA